MGEVFKSQESLYQKEVFKSQESLYQKEAIKPQELPKLKNEDVLMQISRIQKDLEAKKDTYSKGFNEKELVKYKTKTESLNQKYQPKFEEFKNNIQSIQQKKIQASQDAVRVFTAQNPLDINSTIKPIEGVSNTEIGGGLQYISYKMCGIENETMNNGKVKQFVKGLVDSLLVQTGDMADQFKNNPGILVDIIQTILSWNGLCMIAEGLKTSVVDIFTGNAYEKGKAIGDLGLVTSGVALGTKLGKWGIKETMKLGGKQTLGAISDPLALNAVKKQGTLHGAYEYFKSGKSLSSPEGAKRAMNDILKEIGENMFNKANYLNKNDNVIKEILEKGGNKIKKEKLFNTVDESLPDDIKLQNLLNRSKEIQSQCYQIMDEANVGIQNSVVIKPKELKGSVRIKDKVIEEYKGQYRNIVDIVRGTIVCETYDDFEKVLKNLLKNEKTNAIVAKNRLSKNTRDLLISVSTGEPPYVFELQVHVPEVLKYKDPDIFEQFCRGKVKIQEEKFLYKDIINDWGETFFDKKQDLIKKGIEGLDNISHSWSKKDVRMVEILKDMKINEIGVKNIDDIYKKDILKRKEKKLPNLSDKINDHDLYDLRRELENILDETNGKSGEKILKFREKGFTKDEIIILKEKLLSLSQAVSDKAVEQYFKRVK